MSDKPVPITGISFCIATNAKRVDKTILTINSIRSQNWKNIPYEIILCGDIEPFSHLDGLIKVNEAKAAHSAMLARLKNQSAINSKYNEIVFCDDDELPDLGWLDSMIEYSNTNAWDVVSNRILSPDGSRCWDRATLYPHTMVDYSHPEDDPNLYQTGGFLMVRRSVFENVKWDETKFFYGVEEDDSPAEDVQYSKDLVSAGYILKFNKNATVWHNDTSYTAVNFGPRRFIVVDKPTLARDYGYKDPKFLHPDYLYLIQKINNLN